MNALKAVIMPSLKSTLRLRTGVNVVKACFVLVSIVRKRPCASPSCSPANSVVSASDSGIERRRARAAAPLPKIDQAQAPGSTLAAIVTVPLQMQAKTCWFADWFSSAFCGEEPGRS